MKSEKEYDLVIMNEAWTTYIITKHTEDYFHFRNLSEKYIERYEERPVFTSSWLIDEVVINANILFFELLKKRRRK